MKQLPYLLITTLLICFTSCDQDESKNDQFVNSGLVGTWNATSTSGGFAGISCNYQAGEIVLTFDSEGNLTVTKNVLNTTASCGGQEIGVEVGNFTYGVLESNEKKYLLVDDQERGELEVTSNKFTLDSNNSSQGSGADLYFLTFAKE